MKFLCARFYFVIFLSIFNGVVEVSSDFPTVTVSEGLLRGKIMTSANGSQFYAFLGIPYAEPPIDKLRFKDTVPKQAWDGEYDATMDSEACAGITPDNVFVGTEDCLKLNVYTHKINTGSDTEDAEDLYAVYVYIHGGLFVAGSASSKNYPPQMLMTKDIVFVTIYYRLGPLGFLNTRDDAAPGNAGLIDQVTALRWVKKNIGVFGGDANRVTIGGEGAGAASVSYHLISPMSKDLFHGAIMQSGSALAVWAYVEDPISKARELGEFLECTDVINSSLLVQCLQKQSVKDVVTMPKALHPVVQSILSFVPSMEARKNGAFLNESPRKMYDDGKINSVPVITGTLFFETQLMIYPKTSNYVPMFQPLEHMLFQRSFEALLLKYLKLHTGNDDNYKALHYILNSLNTTYVSYKHIFEEALFDLPAELTINSIIKASDAPVYIYKLDDSLFVPEKTIEFTFPGRLMFHGGDLEFLFSQSIRNDKIRMQSIILQMWTNFVITKNPTHNMSEFWPVARFGYTLYYLLIRRDTQKAIFVASGGIFSFFKSNLPNFHTFFNSVKTFILDKIHSIRK